MTKVEAIKKFLKIMVELQHGKLSITRSKNIIQKRKNPKSGRRVFAVFYIEKLKIIKILRKLMREHFLWQIMMKLNSYCRPKT